MRRAWAGIGGSWTGQVRTTLCLGDSSACPVASVADQRREPTTANSGFGSPGGAAGEIDGMVNRRRHDVWMTAESFDVLDSSGKDKTGPFTIGEDTLNFLYTVSIRGSWRGTYTYLLVR